MIGINKKIMGSFILVIALSSISIGMAYFTMKGLIEAINEGKTLSRRVDLIGDLRLYINKLLIPVNKYFIEGDPLERDHYDRRIMQISATLEELKQHKGEGRWQEILRRVGDNTSKLGEMAVEILYMENPARNKKAATLMRETNAFSEQLIDETEEFHNITADEMKKMEELAKDKKERAITMFAAVIIINILALPLLYLYLSRYITRPILALHEGTKKRKARSKAGN